MLWRLIVIEYIKIISKILNSFWNYLFFNITVNVNELLFAVIEENDIDVLVLHVEKSNEDAYRLYERLGYNSDKEEGSRLRMIKFVK